MAQFTSSSKHSSNEVLVSLEDNNPPIESSVSTRDRSQKPSSYHGSDASFWTSSTRINDPHFNFYKKSSAKDDYSWFLEDDFDISCSIKEPESPVKIRIRPLRIAQWVLLLLLLGALISTLSITELRVVKMWDVRVWKWEVLLLVVVCGQLVSSWGVQFAILLIESKFHLKINVLYVVYGVRKSIQNVVWLSLVTFAWNFIMVTKAVKVHESQVPHILRKVMLCFLVATFVWLLKTLILNLLASSFHLRSFYKRIRVSLCKQYVIKKLGGDLIRGKNIVETRNGGVKSVPKLSRQVSFETLKRKKILALKVKRVIEIVQNGDLPCLSTVDEDLPVREDGEDEDESSVRTRDDQVKDLAQKIFQRVAKQSKCILEEDLKRCLGEDKVGKALELFTGARCKVTINENNFIQWMIDAYRERRTLALSLNDTKTAVDDLHHMVNAIVCIMILVIWLIICGAPVTKFLIFMTSQLVLAVYVFGNIGKTVFESIIFLFIMHPYDVGDRCEVDGEQLVVDEMTILTTVFLRCDSQKIIYPNSVLVMKPIGNYSRSPAMGDAIEFSVHISTPCETIKTMKEDITKYINKKSDYWYNNPMILVKDVEDMNRIQMVVWPKHMVNHHDMAQRWRRRSELIEKMLRIFKKHNIQYRMLPREINIRNIGSDRPPSNWTTCYD